MLKEIKPRNLSSLALLASKVLIIGAAGCHGSNFARDIPAFGDLLAAIFAAKMTPNPNGYAGD